MLDVNVTIVLLSIILSRFAFDICSWNSSSVMWLICVTFCCWNHVTPAAQARGAASEASAVWTNAALWWNHDGNVYWRQRVNEQQCCHVVICRNSGPSFTNKFVSAENPNIKKERWLVGIYRFSTLERQQLLLNWLFNLTCQEKKYILTAAKQTFINTKLCCQ